jgi:hypothetical protein
MTHCFSSHLLRWQLEASALPFFPFERVGGLTLALLESPGTLPQPTESIFVLLCLGMEPGALNVLNKCLTTELCSEFFVVFIVWGVGFVFETESHSVAQAVLELILLPSDFQC